MAKPAPYTSSGLRLWPAAVRLVERLAVSLPRMAEDLGRPLRVVELGAGTGLLGMAVSNALGARKQGPRMHHGPHV